MFKKPIAGKHATTISYKNAETDRVLVNRLSIRGTVPANVVKSKPSTDVFRLHVKKVQVRDAHTGQADTEKLTIDELFKSTDR